MTAFQLHLNGKKVCTAGIGDPGVLSANVTWVRREIENPRTNNAASVDEELTLQVGGLVSETDEHVRWIQRRLKVGDEVCIRIVQTARIDRPRSRQRRDRRKELQSQKRYVKEMAKRFGWKIQM